MIFGFLSVLSQVAALRFILLKIVKIVLIGDKVDRRNQRKLRKEF
jgi:hypothetical protein